MQNYLDRILEFLKSEEGASAAEYGLLVGLIALVIVVGVSAFGTNLSGLYDTIVAGLPF
jgi:pilus assembly protein Flp/PilA